MSKNLEVRIFTREQLAARDKRIVARANQATTAHVIREVVKMNSGQQLRAAKDGGKSLLWSEKTLNKFLSHVDED